jgi:WD40 repeat protein
VTSGAASFLLHPRTFARVRTLHISGAAALAPTEDTAAFGQNDGSVKLVDLRTGAVRPMARRAPGRVIGVAFSGDGKVLATASDDGSVNVWDVPTRSMRETFAGHAAAAFGVLFSPDTMTLYSGSSDGTALAWDVRGERRLGRPFRFAPAADMGQGAHTPAQDASTAVAVSPDGSLFVTSPAPGRVTLWRARDQAVLGELRGPSGYVDSLAWSRDGQLVAATGNARQTLVWSVATRTIVKRLGPAGPGGTSGVAFSPDGALVATAGIDGKLRVYALRSGRQIASVQVSGSLQDVDFSPDAKWVATGSLAGKIVIWDVARRTLQRTIDHQDAIVPIRFSPDGKEIASGDSTGKVHFWDPATGRRIGRTLGGQNGWVSSVTFDPSGRAVLTTSADGKLRLWDAASGRLVGTPIPGSDTGGRGTFFPTGERVVAVFASGKGIIWDLDPVAWKTHACRIAHRNLTPAEWRDFLPERRYRAVCP